MVKTADLRRAQRESFWRMYERMSATIALDLSHADGSRARVYEHHGKASVIAFAGTAGKPAFHYSVKSAEEGARYARKHIENRDAHATILGERKAKRAAWKTTLTPGRVLRHSWGYDQTNIDYYQVVEVSSSGRTCVIRKIAARSVNDGPTSMTGHCWPIADQFIGPPMTKRIGEGDEVKIYDWGSWAHPWEPRADYWTAYA